MKIHVLTRRQVVPEDLEKVFSFFEDAQNLTLITPPAMSFEIITPLPTTVRAGALIDYVVRLAGITLRWTTLITHYEAPNRFVDVQLKGPYSYWHHLHAFSEVQGGTEIADTIHYALPAGVVGGLVHALFVRRKLNQIFEYRSAMIEELFEVAQRGNPG